MEVYRPFQQGNLDSKIPAPLFLPNFHKSIAMSHHLLHVMRSLLVQDSMTIKNVYLQSCRKTLASVEPPSLCELAMLSLLSQPKKIKLEYSSMSPRFMTIYLPIFLFSIPQSHTPLSLNTSIKMSGLQVLQSLKESYCHLYFHLNSHPCSQKHRNHCKLLIIIQPWPLMFTMSDMLPKLLPTVRTWALGILSFQVQSHTINNIVKQITNTKKQRKDIYSVWLHKEEEQVSKSNDTPPQ